jgi:hypothetical protein
VRLPDHDPQARLTPPARSRWGVADLPCPPGVRVNARCRRDGSTAYDIEIKLAPGTQTYAFTMPSRTVAGYWLGRMLDPSVDRAAVIAEMRHRGALRAARANTRPTNVEER